MNPAGLGGLGAGAAPVVSLDKLFTILHDKARWRILFALAKGDALPVSELTRRVRKSRDTVQKHMAVLKDAGVVMQIYGRLYKLVPALQPPPGCGVLDFGFCLLRLDVEV
jgi:biotin operon repressor